ncbi:MAG: hypothetical protein U9R19_08695 [Bacteroidota bacterium]|nr:hypothetical protein [Bacteroidota bacterium]
MNKLAIFEDKEIRCTRIENEWYFLIADVVLAIKDTADVKNYIKKLRKHKPALNKIWDEIARPLQFNTNGGWQNINCANTEGIIEIVQCIPSFKTETFISWLSGIDKENIIDYNLPGQVINKIKEFTQEEIYGDVNVVETRELRILPRRRYKDICTTEM